MPPCPTIRVAVDLSHLHPGGENGGIKPFLFETLLWLGRQGRVPLIFLYLTCARTHAEVREQLARVEDEVICVREDGGPLPYGGEQVPRERLCAPPPLDLLARLAADVLYCPFGPVTFAMPGIPTISTIVDVLHRDFPASLGPPACADRESAFQEIVAVADALQCNSRHVVARMREHYDVSAERMFTVYNAVHGRFAVLPAAETSDAAGRAAPLPASPFFFYPSNFWSHKNHERLLAAYVIYRAGAVANGLTPWPLLLTGHQDERWQEVHAAALALGLTEEQGVHFAGYVPPDDFGRLWEAAGALVFPSLHEGFGIPLLEAMAHGLPILCSRAGSLPEVGAEASLFVDAHHPEALAEGMSLLAYDPALRQRLVLAGRRRLRDFSLDHEAGVLLDVILRLACATRRFCPFTRGISEDGRVDRFALLALPGTEPDAPAPGRLSLRFHPVQESRRVRLRAGDLVELGSFVLPAGEADPEITVDFLPAGGALRMEVLAAGPALAHAPAGGLRLLAATVRLADGQDHSLLPTR